MLLKNPALDASTEEKNGNLGGNYIQLIFLNWVGLPENNYEA